MLTVLHSDYVYNFYQRLKPRSVIGPGFLSTSLAMTKSWKSNTRMLSGMNCNSRLLRLLEEVGLQYTVNFDCQISAKNKQVLLILIYKILNEYSLLNCKKHHQRVHVMSENKFYIVLQSALTRHSTKVFIATVYFNATTQL